MSVKKRLLSPTVKLANLVGSSFASATRTGSPSAGVYSLVIKTEDSIKYLIIENIGSEGPTHRVQAIATAAASYTNILPGVTVTLGGTITDGDKAHLEISWQGDPSHEQQVQISNNASRADGATFTVLDCSAVLPAGATRLCVSFVSCHGVYGGDNMTVEILQNSVSKCVFEAGNSPGVNFDPPLILDVTGLAAGTDVALKINGLTGAPKTVYHAVHGWYE